MKKRPRHSVNQGIQANTVRADVLAVGDGARAAKYTGAADVALAEAIEHLREAISQLSLDPAASRAIEQDLRQLPAAASDPASVQQATSALSGVVAKIQSAGVAISEVVRLGEAVTGVATLLKVPLALIGL